mmetsp:Transcript_11641/g.11675  ORF Transcript_11641/g.11675 Transcript_11641/m.11675 type:complete len:468 (-) Transcript_11641:297-1700(-)|eukprot:CAMPEP_0182416998 /NCGR_PEP_ID=MMETSP1167-20130531/1428_1 /TAXON_ID=2988 /ORGANISM="Mallomonas Sp, Strain CCMP3275" /LENGTH=467 /DNA_ID=CAMNT_0024590253 /DNA_START=97 /DNA_END=1500 /DNA_ORIENTATION=+
MIFTLITFSLQLSVLLSGVSAWHHSPSSKVQRSLSKIANTILKVSSIDRDVDTPTKQKTQRQPLNVRIDNIWYDLSGWRKSHPAGDHWIDLYSNRDATEVMHGFHSERGRSMYQRLPRSKNVEELEEIAGPVSQLTLNFRKLRDKLEADGWWKRDLLHEARLISIWATLFGSGVFLSKTAALPAVVLLALANTAAGWIGHDYIHGVDKFSFRMRNFAAITAGMSPTWWSDKHNKHHALTNEVGVDEDIATDPAIYVYPPAPEKDTPARKFQHLYLPLPLSLLFLIWRIDSAKLCFNDAMNGFKRKTQGETISQLLHYAFMFTFVPIPVFLGQLFLAGLMTATIVTVTHQSEDLFFEHNRDFVDAQFRSTRDAKCMNIFTDWLWGGMQWQLEHHLFPSMPRSKYPALSKILKKFAKENNIEYRVTDELDILKLNWEMYRDNAAKPAIPGQPHFEGKEVNWGGRGEKVL